MKQKCKDCIFCNEKKFAALKSGTIVKLVYCYWGRVIVADTKFKCKMFEAKD